MKRKQLVEGLLLWGIVLSCLFGATAVAVADESHVLDEFLSLNGSCTTDSLDAVPDPSCPQEPPTHPFASPYSVATDNYGDIYVLNMRETEGDKGAHLDIFDATGHFISELAIPGPDEAKSVAVDSKGNLYVFVNTEVSPSKILLFEPSVYSPGTSAIAYGAPSSTISDAGLGSYTSLAINRLNDHLYYIGGDGGAVKELTSAEEGNSLIDDFGACTPGCGNQTGRGLSVDAAHNRIYIAGNVQSHAIVQMVELAAPHNVVGVVKGAETPSGGEFPFRISIAADEGDGHLFVYPEGAAEVPVFEFSEDGTYLSTITHSFRNGAGADLTVDNGTQSPNGGQSPDGRYLFVPSHPLGTGHVFAFGPPKPECAPEVETVSFTEVTEADALLRATINPCHLKSEYAFEYTTLEMFEAKGFEGASVAGGGQVPAAEAGVDVSGTAQELLPGTTYRFRVVASNSRGSDQMEGSFTTFPLDQMAACPNEGTRTGPSALLPDCRAYELVTPPETHGLTPGGVGLLGIFFSTGQVSPPGTALSYVVKGGALPGAPASAGLAGDPYVARRGEDGWSTSFSGPTGSEASAPNLGSTSPDQGYSFWEAGGEGSALANGGRATYVRYADGQSSLIGRGSMGVDPVAFGELITENGSHVIFMSKVPLEAHAPSAGTMAVYDRTSDEVTHVVSLLPEDATPGAGQDATYLGASPDGRGIVFAIGSALYLRFDNEETLEVANEATFAGVSENGRRVFYVKGGNLFAFEAGSVIPFTVSGDITVVNVSADGSTAYFVSPSVLTEQPNPAGVKPTAGSSNLYVSREGAIRYVGAVSDADVERPAGEDVEGLGTWIRATGAFTGEHDRFGLDPSRATPDGNALLFASEANLTGYAPKGHTEIYLYEYSQQSLRCLSCNPTGAPAAGEASLQSNSHDAYSATPPFSSFALVANLRMDGHRAFFQSTERLVTADTDGLQDVYEWEADGVGSCNRSSGCVYLISSGHSLHDDYLFAVSDNGDDVFFRSGDLLVPADAEQTPSIYDARVGGGFLESRAGGECEGEGCRPDATSPPALAAPGTPALGAHDQIGRHRRCPKGQRRIRRHDRVRCVRRQGKHHHNHRHSQTGSKRKGVAR